MRTLSPAGFYLPGTMSLHGERLGRILDKLVKGWFYKINGERLPGGYAIVKHVVDNHGGTVSVRSTAAEGTTFTIRLPRRP